MGKYKDIKLVLLISVLCMAAIPLSVWFAQKPLRADTSKELIDKGFLIQNRSEVATLVANKVGWQSLRQKMLQAGAGTVETDKVLLVAQLKMSQPYRFRLATASLWPVLVKPAHIGSERVWLFEGAAPSKPIIFDCGTGVTAWQRYKVRKRNKEVCAHRVFIVQAHEPYEVIGSKDIRR